MLISLVGIIWIQTSWIGNAIAEQEQDFKVRVNEALNAVNDSIDTEEVELFLKQEFGGIDSMVNQIVKLPDGKDQSLVEINLERDGVSGRGRDEMVIIRSSNSDSNNLVNIYGDSSYKSQVFISNDELNDTSNSLIWSGVQETRYSVVDSIVVDSEVVVRQKKRVETMIQRFTFETLLSGELEDRIDHKELKGKIKRALHKEGISGTFTYAVKNGKTGNYEVDYTSLEFDSTQANAAFSKRLFQSDRRGRMNYTLVVQPEGSGNFVWSKVWKMTALSIAFTVLILLSFGYALYFIFKQKKVSQIKNDFINNMTHELKTPLASISLATASIRHPEIIKNSEEIRRLVKLIEDEKDRINSHVERVLDTAALDAGELKLSAEKVSIRSILNQAEKNVELSLLHVNGTIRMPEDLDFTITGDSFHLTNVFTNIFDNGIKYRSNEAPEMDVDLMQGHGWAVVTIKDNGIGMTTKQQKHAFDKFYRAETGDIHTRKGFGLGLSYVKSVVEKLGGKVQMESKPNEGTTITIQIPSHE